MDSIGMTKVELSKHAERKGWRIFSASDAKNIGLYIKIYLELDSFDENIIDLAVDGMNGLIEVSVSDSDAVLFVVKDQCTSSGMAAVISAATEIIGTAKSRHTHNTRVQRMSKNASLKNIERCYGEHVGEIIRAEVSWVPKVAVVKQNAEVQKKPRVVALAPMNPTITNVDESVENLVEMQVQEMTASGLVVDKAWRAGMKNNFFVLKDFIDRRDYFQLKEFLLIKHVYWRRFFTGYTGHILPMTDKETVKFLTTFASF